MLPNSFLFLKPSIVHREWYSNNLNQLHLDNKAIMYMLIKRTLILIVYNFVLWIWSHLILVVILGNKMSEKVKSYFNFIRLALSY